MNGVPLPTTASLVIVGSQALRYHLVLDREPKDVDYIGTFDAVQAFLRGLKPDVAYPLSANKWYAKKRDTIFEFEIAWEGTSAAEFLTLSEEIPSLDLLYTLKMSHRFLKNSPHFKKTMNDITLMRSAGARLVHPEWLKRREAETYTYAHPKLNQTKADFFSADGIDYIYDHDSLHEAMKFGDRPAYTMYAVPGEEVKSSRILFEDLPFPIRINAVLEEALVLALERSQIPFPQTDPDRSFEIALMKVCTSITSGWFRSFAYDSYHDVMTAYRQLPISYVERFRLALDDGIVKPFQK